VERLAAAAAAEHRHGVFRDASDHAAGLAFNADFVVATAPALELGHGGRLTR